MPAGRPYLSEIQWSAGRETPNHAPQLSSLHWALFEGWPCEPDTLAMTATQLRTHMTHKFTLESLYGHSQVWDCNGLSELNLITAPTEKNF